MTLAMMLPTAGPMVLTQEHHVKLLVLHAPRLVERKVVADLVAHTQGIDMGKYAAVEQRQPVGRIICKLVTPFLRFQQQGEGRVTFNIDPLDRIHLHRDFEAHDYLWANKALTIYTHYSRFGTDVARAGGPNG